MSDIAPSNSYDEVLYHSTALDPTHPIRLATIATLMGMHPAPVEHCRVLELGCATGGNLIPMAYALPHSEFVGIDLSERQIIEGQTVVEKLGLRNITLQRLNILDVPPDFGAFDYIIAYGIYSWVMPEVQHALLQICKQCLTPNGVALISYNTYPGWHMRGMVRDMLLYHSRHFEGLTAQTAQAWSFLNVLVEGTTTLRSKMPSLDLYNQLLLQELDILGKRPPFYFVHEHMEGSNEPVYFHQFADRAASHGLQYLADANFASSLTMTLPREIAATLEQIAPHRIAVEQYIDFFTNRTFRQSLMCHADQTLQTNLAAIPLSALQVASSAAWIMPDDAAYVSGVAKIRTPEGNVLALNSPLAKAAMELLINTWPQALRFNELLVRARNQISSESAAENDFAELAAAANHLGETMFKCYLANAVEFRVYTPQLVHQAGDRPLASAIAREEVQRGSTVTNLLHMRVDLDEACVALLPLLDGSRDRLQLRIALAQQIAEGRLTPEEPTIAAQPMPLRQEALTMLVDAVLHELARSALLLS